MKNIGKDNHIILGKYIYSLTQTARQCNKKAAKNIKNLGFIGCDVGPYLYMKKNQKATIHVRLHVDDYLLIGNPEAIDKTLELF